MKIASRYGRASIERDATPVALASKEQIDTLEELLGVRSDGPTLLEKWLDKSQAETLAEMPAETAQKCIEFLTSKASAKKETGNASAA